VVAIRVLSSSPLDAFFGDVATAVVGEGGTLALSTPAGELFTEVLFASYGTPSTGPQAAWPFVRGQCHAQDSEQLVDGAFLERATGSIDASNSIFGDPCGGTVKSLAVALVYRSAIPVVVPFGESISLVATMRTPSGQLDAAFSESATLSGTAGITGAAQFSAGLLRLTLIPTEFGLGRSVVVSAGPFSATLTLDVLPPLVGSVTASGVAAAGVRVVG
jgi:hypothetical protein